MHALTLARQRLRARIQNPSTPKAVRLAHGLAEEGRGKFIPILSSPLAQEILSRGYDAATLDRVYANRPSAELGLVGKMADRLVMDLPVHQGMRERFQATVGEISAAAVMSLRGGAAEFRALLAPCGFGNEMVEVADRLRARHPEMLANVRLWGVDPDRDGHQLPEARRRTAAAGIQARFIREDLRRHREVLAEVEREGPFHLVSCVGLSQKLSLTELAEEIRFFCRILAPGGTLLIDRWQPSEPSKVAAGLGISMPCERATEFRAALEAAGLQIEREHPSGEGGSVLLVARKPE